MPQPGLSRPVSGGPNLWPVVAGKRLMLLISLNRKAHLLELSAALILLPLGQKEHDGLRNLVPDRIVESLALFGFALDGAAVTAEATTLVTTRHWVFLL